MKILIFSLLVSSVLNLVYIFLGFEKAIIVGISFVLIELFIYNQGQTK